MIIAIHGAFARRPSRCNLPTSRCIFISLMLLLTGINSGCGGHPSPLESTRDVRRASADLEQIRIGLLPISDYPLLSKFKRLKDVDFFTLKGTGADDAKLEALSKIKLETLEGVLLLNCPEVTDAGIHWLSTIPSLKWVGLEGTSITDKSLATMASKMKLTAVNVSNCKVTKQGLMSLAASSTLKEFSFSADALTQEDVVELVNQFEAIKWCGIVDPGKKLDVPTLKKLGDQKGVRIVVKPTGSLQDVVAGGRN
jgi:hypothetical protein